MAAYLSPLFGAGAQLFNNQGIVLSGGKIWTYQAGTTTAQTTWTDSTQVVANANPIILDSAGRPPNEIWLLSGQPYKFILTDSNDNTLGTWDNVSGINDVSFTAAVSEWQSSSLTPTYISSTSFSVPGNNVAMFQTNRRVQITVTSGTIYGYVVSSSFSSVTTVVIQPDSTGLDSGISVVNLGLLTVTHPSVPQEYLAFNAPVNVSSATSPTPIGAALSANVTITGTTTITAFDNVIAGIVRFAKFSDVLTLTHNGTSLILPGGVNITTAAGDQAVFRSLGSGNWECLNYLPVTFTLYPVVSEQLSITCTQGSGALTFGLDDCVIRFRSATLTSGEANTRVIYTPVSLVVPSGATLGTPTTATGRLVLVAIDNAGTVETAVVNITGGNNLDETTLISTTTISAGATANNVFYSTTGRSNVPFKVVGFVDAINTAGAWSNPTLVQSAGGNIFVSYIDQQHDAQIFTANGTWTKPAWVTPNATIRVEMWGGGGGGSAGGGGGGGAYACRTFKASDLGATEPVVVGAGGTVNNVGGDSSFSSSTNIVTAYGGGAGANANFGGGGGGGTYSAGVSGSGAAGGTGGAGYSSGGVATTAGNSATGDAGAGGSSTGGVAYHAFMGGGGGVRGSSAGLGGFSTYGGGGGGTNASGGGLSLYGGDGGTGAVAGSIPGGAGGTNGSTTGTAGARGEVRVYIF